MQLISLTPGNHTALRAEYIPFCVYQMKREIHEEIKEHLDPAINGRGGRPKSFRDKEDSYEKCFSVLGKRNKSLEGGKVSLKIKELLNMGLWDTEV